MPDHQKELTDTEIIKFLLFQQFYYGSDLIYGRTREISEEIDGSGPTIEIFYKKLVRNIDMIRNKDYKGYLRKFNEDLFPIDINAIFDSFMRSYRNIQGHVTLQLATSLLVGELLMSIKRQCFDEALSEIKIFLIDYISSNYKDFSDSRIELIEDYIDERMQKLNQLFALNSGDIGMIYNLSFLKFIAFKLDELKVYKITKKILKKYMEKVVHLLLEEIK